MLDIPRRMVHARPELAAELLRRGAFTAKEKVEIARAFAKGSPRGVRLGPVQFSTLLAGADSQLAARAVLRGALDAQELRWLDRLLRFRKPNKKRDELIRIVERALERRKGNGHKCR